MLLVWRKTRPWGVIFSKPVLPPWWFSGKWYFSHNHGSVENCNFYWTMIVAGRESIYHVLLWFFFVKAWWSVGKHVGYFVPTFWVYPPRMPVTTRITYTWSMGSLGSAFTIYSTVTHLEIHSTYRIFEAPNYIGILIGHCKDPPWVCS